MSIDMPERNSTSGFGVEHGGSSASAIPRKRRRTGARRKRKKKPGKTLDFTAIGSRKCDYTRGGRIACASKRAYVRLVVAGCAKVPRLRVQGHAECGHVSR